MEVSIRNDPELAAEVITLLGRELIITRERIRTLESQIRHGVTSTRLALSSSCVLIYYVEQGRVNRDRFNGISRVYGCH